MKNRRILKSISIVFCFFLICVSLVACGNGIGRNKFYKGAKKHLKDKYGVKCDSLVYYESPQNDKYNTFEFGVIELKNGERVVVSLSDGNYADSYELLDLYSAWMEKLTLEFGAQVIIADLYSNGLAQEPNIGQFFEQSTKRYNASNVDEFEEDLFDFTYKEEILIYIVEPDPTAEWMSDLADKLNVYLRKVGGKEIEAYVIPEPVPIGLNLYPDEYYKYINSYGRELEITYDTHAYHHYDTHKFYDSTVDVTLMSEW